MGDQEESESGPTDGEGYKAGCNCAAIPQVPLPQHPSDPVLTDVNAGLSLQRVDENPTLYGVWPSLSTRAARAPNPPPEVVCRTCPVFTQVFRL